MGGDISTFIKQPGNHAQLLAVCDQDTKALAKVKIGFLNAVQKDSKIANCSNESLMTCLLESTELNLPIGINNLAYVIPYKGTAKFRPSYLGLIKIIKEIYPDAHIVTELIFRDDIFESSSENGQYVYKHKPANEFEEDDAQAIGCFSYIEYTDENGKKKTYIERVPLKDLLSAKGQATTKDVWNKWFSQQAKKMTIRRMAKVLIQGNKKLDKLIKLDNEDYELKDVTPKKEPVNYDDIKPLDVENPSKKEEEAEEIIDAEVDESIKEEVETEENEETNEV